MSWAPRPTARLATLALGALCLLPGCTAESEQPGTITVKGQDRDAIKAQMINPSAGVDNKASSGPDKKSKGIVTPGGKGAPAQ